MATKREITLLEQGMKQAHANGDTQLATQFAQALKIAIGTAAEDPVQPEPTTPQVEKSGLLGSLAAGTVRQGGRFKAGFDEMSTLLGGAMEGNMGGSGEELQAIADRERQAEAQFSAQTADHPIAAGVGQALPFLPLGAAGTIPGAMLAGAGAGALSYTEDPSDRAAQAAIGGAANTIIPGGARLGLPTHAAARNTQLGLKTLPEQRGPVLFRKGMQNLGRTKKQAFDISTANTSVVTREFLDTLGEGGQSITHSTLGNVKSRASALFKEAAGSRENVHFGKGFYKNIDNLLDEQTRKILRRSVSKGRKPEQMLTEVRDNLQQRGNILSVDEYQNFRSDISDMILSETKPRIKRALGDILETVDNAAELSLSAGDPRALKNLREGRRLWRQLHLAKQPGVIDYNSGQVNPHVLRNVLRRDDEPGFLLNGNQGKLYEQLRVTETDPAGAVPQEFLSAFRDFRVNPEKGFFGSAFTRALEVPLVGASRLPVRAAEGAPLGIAVPATRSLLSPSEEVEMDLNSL